VVVSIWWWCRYRREGIPVVGRSSGDAPVVIGGGRSRKRGGEGPAFGSVDRGGRGVCSRHRC